MLIQPFDYGAALEEAEGHRIALRSVYRKLRKEKGFTRHEAQEILNHYLFACWKYSMRCARLLRNS